MENDNIYVEEISWQAANSTGWMNDESNITLHK